MSSPHFAQSSLRESIVEHVFVGDVLRSLWRRGIFDLEIMHSEFDAFGYDLVMSRGSIVRHVQFKTSTKKKPVKVSLSLELAKKPSGCAVWIGVSDQLDLETFYWFGGEPTKPLPSLENYKMQKKKRRTKDGMRGDRQRHRDVPGRDFRKIESLDDLLIKLLGPLNPTASD